jgi:hypothetical protein
MKETNLLESQLRSWRPRRPSPNLKRRLFPATRAAAREFLWPLRCLAPAAACLLVVLATLNQSGGMSAPAARPGLMLSMLGSNRIACPPFDTQQEHNRILGLSFESTNRSESRSSVDSILPEKMN